MEGSSMMGSSMVGSSMAGLSRKYRHQSACATESMKAPINDVRGARIKVDRHGMEWTCRESKLGPVRRHGGYAPTFLVETWTLDTRLRGPSASI